MSYFPNILLMNMKFKVDSPEQSTRLQEVLFKLGYKWSKEINKVEFIDQPYLYTYNDSYILYGYILKYFNDHKNILIDTETFIKHHTLPSCPHNTINAITMTCQDCGLSIDQI